MKEIILGSKSPRRREILGFFSLPVRQISSDFDEAQVSFQGDPAAFACKVAHEKALCLSKQFPKDVILTADTVVYQKGRLFQKPESLAEAKEMLSSLAGQEHRVWTGVCAARGGDCFIEAEETLVEFNQLTENEILTYHKWFDPLDKSGGYAIQKAGSLIVKRIEGCYYNIMGLPLQTTHRLLLKVGIDLWDYLKSV